MNCLKRNKKSFWYCNPSGNPIECMDEYGNYTGERVQPYHAPQNCQANISQATGVYRTEEFGSVENYDRVIVIAGTDCPITEKSVLFVDKEPTKTTVSVYVPVPVSGSTVPVLRTYVVPVPDYIVWRVSVSLNYTAIAIKKATIGPYGTEEPYDPSPK